MDVRQEIRKVADEVEVVFIKHGCRLTTHTRHEVVCGDMIEEHLHWSSATDTTTVDVRVSCDVLRVKCTDMADWLTLRHDQVDELRHAVVEAQCYPCFPSPQANNRTSTTYLTDLDPNTLTRLLDYVPFSDLRSLLQTGARQLLRRMRATYINRIDAETPADVSYLRNSSSARKLMPLVRVIRIHSFSDTKYEEYDVHNLPRTVTSLHTPLSTVLQFRSEDKADPLIHLQDLSTGNLSPIFSIELVMPNLTSLNIQRDGDLQCGAMVALPSMLHTLSIPIHSWERLIEATDNGVWPSLHTLTIKHSKNASVSIHLLPNAKQYPALTSLTLDGVKFQPNSNLDTISDMLSLTHLAIISYRPMELISLMYDTTRAFPAQLISVMLDINNKLIDFSSLKGHLLRLLPSSVQRITLRGLNSSDVSFATLMDLPNLTRICLDADEYCRTMVNGCGTLWQTFSSLVQKADEVEPCAFERFELVRSRQPVGWNLMKAVSVLLEKCPLIGVQMAARCPRDVHGLCQILSVFALHQWLKYSTCPYFDFTIVPTWACLLHSISMKSAGMTRIAGVLHYQSGDVTQLADVLHHHSLHTHPIMFRYLLHLTFLFALRSDGLSDFCTYDAHTSDEILLHLSSKYGYNRILNSPSSLPTLMSLLKFARGGVSFTPTHAQWEDLIEMMERPSWADACCRGEVEHAPWFDHNPVWRAACIVRDMLLRKYNDKETYEVTMAMNSLSFTDIKVNDRHRERVLYFKIGPTTRAAEVVISVIHPKHADLWSPVSYVCPSLNETKSYATEALQRAKSLYDEL